MKIYNETGKVNTFGQLKKIKIKCKDNKELELLNRKVQNTLMNNKSFNSLCENNDVHVIGKVNKERRTQSDIQDGDGSSFDLIVKVSRGIFKKLYSSIHFNPGICDRRYTCYNYIYGVIKTHGHREYTPGINTFSKFMGENQGFFDNAKTGLNIEGEIIHK